MVGASMLVPFAVLVWTAAAYPAAGPAATGAGPDGCAGRPATGAVAGGDQLAQGCPPQPRCGPGEQTCNVRVENGCVLWECCPR